MFRHTNNIDRSFRVMRGFMLAAVAGSFSVCLYALYKNAQVTRLAQERMYVIAGEKAVLAFASGRKDNIMVEARDHVKTFHQLFFSLDPDEKVIEANTGRALYLADGTAKRQYDDLKEKGFYEGIISGNISQELQVDSIAVSIAQEPYLFRFYGTLRIVRPTSILTRSLVTSGRLRNVSRSDNNPHGLLIERWEIIENNDKHIETRE